MVHSACFCVWTTDSTIYSPSHPALLGSEQTFPRFAVTNIDWGVFEGFEETNAEPSPGEELRNNIYQTLLGVWNEDSNSDESNVDVLDDERSCPCELLYLTNSHVYF